MPRKGAFLETGVLQRVLTEVIRLAEVQTVGPNPVTGVPIERGTRCEDEGRGWGDAPSATQHHRWLANPQELGQARSRTPSQSQRAPALPTPDFTPQPPDLGEIKFLLFKLSDLWYFVVAAPGN